MLSINFNITIYCNNNYEQEYTLSSVICSSRNSTPYDYSYQIKRIKSPFRLPFVEVKIRNHLFVSRIRKKKIRKKNLLDQEARNHQLTTHLKQIVTFIVHPHLVGWMLLGTLALACVENLRRRAPGQLDREGPLQEQQASGGPRAPWVRPVSQYRGHFSGPVANDSKQSAAVASRGLEKRKGRRFSPSLHGVFNYLFIRARVY